LNHHSGFSFKERIAGINYGSYYALKGHIAQNQGDHLDRVLSDQKVLEKIRRGWLVLVIGRQESPVTQEDYQA
jgi:hypothetical protein